MTSNRRRKASIRNRATQGDTSYTGASNNSHRQDQLTAAILGNTGVSLDLRPPFIGADPLLDLAPIGAVRFITHERSPMDPRLAIHLSQLFSRIENKIGEHHPILTGDRAVRLLDLVRSAMGTRQDGPAFSETTRRGNVGTALHFASQHPVATEDGTRALALGWAWLDGDAVTEPEYKTAYSRTQRRTPRRGPQGAYDYAEQAAGNVVGAITMDTDGRQQALAAMLRSGDALAVYLDDPTDMWLDRAEDYLSRYAATYGTALGKVPLYRDGFDRAAERAREQIARVADAESRALTSARPAILNRYLGAPAEAEAPEPSQVPTLVHPPAAIVLSTDGLGNGARADVHEFLALEAGLHLREAASTTDPHLVTVLDHAASMVADVNGEIAGLTAVDLLAAARLGRDTRTGVAADAQRRAVTRVTRHLVKAALSGLDDVYGSRLTQRGFSVLAAHGRDSSVEQVLNLGRSCLAPLRDGLRLGPRERRQIVVGYALLTLADHVANGLHEEAAEQAYGAAVQAFVHAGEITAADRDRVSRRRAWISLTTTYLTAWRNEAGLPAGPEVEPERTESAAAEAAALWAGQASPTRF